MRWLFGLLLLSSVAGVAAEDCTLRMSVETDFPPHIIKQGEQWSGLSVELMQKLAASVACKLEFVNSPWLRALQLSEAGELDILSHLSFNIERQPQFAFIGPHHNEAIYLIGDPTQLPALTQLHQLADDTDLGRIAVLHGAYYGEDFKQLSSKPQLAQQLVVISSIQDKLALLRAGRVNAILEDISVLQYWQQQDYPQASMFQPLLKVYESPVYFGFSKKSLSAARIKALASAWQKLNDSGELKPIYAKYQITTPQTPAPKL